TQVGGRQAADVIRGARILSHLTLFLAPQEGKIRDNPEYGSPAETEQVTAFAVLGTDRCRRVCAAVWAGTAKTVPIDWRRSVAAV
ncbi:MAG: hypothetical protein VYB24_02590, partial [Pseudomonadota bacterium]|nr:hypothetical protein [Pseudomonadota bacterium]